MVKNYIKIALRGLVRERGYSLINIVGLSISLSVTLLMLLWVNDEWSIDKFHENADRLYRVKRTIPLEGNNLDVYNGIPYPVLEWAQRELPEVEKFIPLARGFEETLIRGNATFREIGAFGNLAYFESFSYSVLAGDITQLDQKVNAIAISERLAERLFGNLWQSIAIGQSIQIHDIGEFSVESVFANFPDNSSIQNDFIYSFGHYLKDNDWMLEWTNSGMQGVLLLAEGTDPESTEKKIQEAFHLNQDGDRKEGILLQKYGDHHLYGEFNDRAEVAGGRIGYVQTFGIAALLLLMISCINFVNLATARASRRAKEVGVRKTIGAGKKSLLLQFMSEAAIVTSISIALGAMLSTLLLPHVRQITSKALMIDLSAPTFWVGTFSIFCITTLLSGAYPAFVLSSFRPVSVLKGHVVAQTGNASFRKGLVVIQFALALLLIVGALVVKQQVGYIKNKNLGIAKENLMVIHQDEKITEKYDVFRNQLITKSGISNVTLAGPSPIDMQASTSGLSWPGKRPDQENIEFQILWSASNFLDVFDVPLVSGRFYREGSIYDTTTIVFNQRAIDIMEMEDPIGKSVQWWGKPRQIIGIVKDFHNRSLYENIEPAAFLLDSENAGWCFVKARDGQISEAINSLRSTFASVLPEVPLHFEFVDAQYQAFYEGELLTEKLASYFAIISILLSCLGLFGLATFFAEQKDKEIGIRKVLGASVYNVVGLLSKEFLTLVIIGLMIGIPVAWYVIDGWLGNYEFKVDLKPWMFIIPVSIAICIAGLTVGFQAIRAALINPIKSLRNE